MTAGGLREDLESVRRELTGSLVLPDDPEYDEARRVWNGMIDRRPLAIIRAGSLDDIRVGLRIARHRELALAIRGGGHNVAGNGTVDRGLVLDLGALNAVAVDPETRTVRVGPGATLGDLDRATEPFGLAVPVGVVSGTGIAGLTLGGGFGWLVRAYGLAVDNLLGVELITANGEAIRADSSENPDLFWGIRGGGGNFGVVTSFTFQAHPLGPDVYAGTLIYGRPRWAEVLRAYAAWTREVPDEMSSIVTFLVPPPEFELGDQVLMLVGFAWAGNDRTEGERALAPLQAAAPPDTELIEPTTWVAWQSASDPVLPKGARAYWKNVFFDRLDDPIIDLLAEHAAAQTWIGTGTDLHHMAGAFGRVPEDATPFPNRSAQYWLNIYGFWKEAADDAHHTAWVRGLNEAMEPHAMGRAYVNALAQERGVDARQQALAIYGPAKFARLAALKRTYDPENLFRLNHNIPPE